MDARESRKEKRDLIFSMKMELIQSVEQQINETTIEILKLCEGDSYKELLSIAEPMHMSIMRSDLGSAINEGILAEILSKSKIKIIEPQDFVN